MKTKSIKWTGIGVTGAAVVLAFVTAARADDRILARVPFDFIADGVHMPAGKYVVTEAANGSVLSIASADGREHVYTLTIPSGAARTAQPQLVFDKFNNHYFLSGVVPMQDEPREIVLTPSVMEHEINQAADRATN